LAGDTLNILALDSQNVCFYIADVCGHGVASSLLSVMLSRLLSSGTGGEGVLVRHNPVDDSVEIVPPAEVVRNLNDRFPWNPEAMEYFTIFYGIYNSAARELSYVCAGHPPPILVPPSGPPSRLVADPPAVGLLPNAEFPEHRLQLAPGDRVFAFTDGIVESLGTADEEFGEARLVASVSAPRLADLPGSISAVIQDVDAWRAGADPADDQCIIGVEAQ
jgi:sigma-B regulation protein RsbU (phosphoserine phosphatase)